MSVIIAWTCAVRTAVSNSIRQNLLASLGWLACPLVACGKLATRRETDLRLGHPAIAVAVVFFERCSERVALVALEVLPETLELAELDEPGACRGTRR